MLHWKLKACTRCGGDLFIDRDMDGWFAQCLQCSLRRELKDIRELKRQPVPVGAKYTPTEDWSKDEK
ncbi:MAG: hypothetical protein PHY28_07585 [Dehalococcoidales bacterium]|nr:hypothetical protein [Dehalococcoidales bacterium]